jgi:hypothetical protein
VERVVAVDTALLVVGVIGVVVAVVAIVVIVAPWKGVRDEHPLPTDVETRLLLGEDPGAVAADVDRDDARGASVHDLERDETPTPTTNGDAAFAELERLEREPVEPPDEPTGATGATEPTERTESTEPTDPPV